MATDAISPRNTSSIQISRRDQRDNQSSVGRSDRGRSAEVRSGSEEAVRRGRSQEHGESEPPYGPRRRHRRGGSRDDSPPPEVTPSPAPEAGGDPVPVPPVAAESGSSSESTPGASSSPTSSSPGSSSSVRRPRERIQISIAREGGFIKDTAPPVTDSASSSSSTPASNETQKGSRIQDQLLQNGAGFVSAIRERPSAGGGSASGGGYAPIAGSLENDAYASYQSPGDQLKRVQTEQVLSTLSTDKAK